MKKTVYFVFTAALNVIALIIFSKQINLTILSICPIAIIALLIFQGMYFLKEQSKSDFHTAYNTSNATDDDYEKLYHLMGNSMLCLIPWVVPSVFFFSSAAKCIVSVLLYTSSLLLGRIIFRIKYGKAMNARIYSEKTTLEMQRANEELGKWK